MEHAFSRTELLLGEAALQRLQQARVAVFGVGGVGGYVVEALARSGVGALDLIDHDVVSLTNLNRQIIALHSTLGQEKVAVAKTVFWTLRHPVRCAPIPCSIRRKPPISSTFLPMIMS